MTLYGSFLRWKGAYGGARGPVVSPLGPLCPPGYGGRGGWVLMASPNTMNPWSCNSDARMQKVATVGYSRQSITEAKCPIPAASGMKVKQASFHGRNCVSSNLFSDSVLV